MKQIIKLSVIFLVIESCSPEGKRENYRDRALMGVDTTIKQIPTDGSKDKDLDKLVDLGIKSPQMISKDISTVRLFMTPKGKSSLDFHASEISLIESQPVLSCDVTKCFKNLFDFNTEHTGFLWNEAVVGIATLKDGSKRKVYVMEHENLIALTMEGSPAFLLQKDRKSDYKDIIDCLMEYSK